MIFKSDIIADDEIQFERVLRVLRKQESGTPPITATFEWDANDRMHYSVDGDPMPTEVVKVIIGS